VSIDDPDVVAARHNELRDIHHRIDSLKEENERQYNSLTEKLHALEVAIASGNRFPAAAWVAAAALFVTVIGSGFVTYHKLETAQNNGIKAIALIEKHMEGSGERFAAIREANAVTNEWEKRLPALESRVKTLEDRIVGQGPNGWHRPDHELYAKMMDERNDRIKLRLDTIEKRQDDICERVKNCGGKR
jgi:chaperonin cofactor prefoldin